MIEAVLFDVGQTLLNFGRLRTGSLFAQSAMQSYQWLVKHSQPVGGFTAYRIIHWWGLYWHIAKSFLTGKDFDSLTVLKNYGVKRGYLLSDEQYRELNWVWYEPLSHRAYTESDLITTLETLSAMGLKLGLLSNTFVHKDSLQRHLERVGVLRFFPVQLYTCDYPWRKPDVRIFQQAAKEMGVAAEKTMYVGDRVDNDVVGSSRAAMIPVWKRVAGKQPRLPQGTLAIDKLSELPALIEKRNSEAAR